MCVCVCVCVCRSSRQTDLGVQIDNRDNATMVKILQERTVPRQRSPVRKLRSQPRPRQQRDENIVEFDSISIEKAVTRKDVGFICGNCAETASVSRIERRHRRGRSTF